MYDDFNGLVIEMLILADAIKSHYPTYVNLVTDEDHFKKHCCFRLILKGQFTHQTYGLNR